MTIRAAFIAAALVAVLPAGAHAGPVDDYESSWTHRALGLQYELSSDVELRNAPWVGTHNSFNSEAEMGPTLSDQDSNQKLPIVDQLRIDVRSIELDVHWFPSASGGGFAPVVCHATEEHAGCSVEKPLRTVLDEVGGWLRSHPDQVLLLYLEDHLDNQDGYDAGAAAIQEKIGDLVYRPASAGAACEPLPMSVTRNQIRAAGKQVLIMSRCGVGTAWRSYAFDGSARKEARPVGYRDFPDCGPDFTRAEYDSTMIRYFEDSTQLTARFGTPDDGIPPATAAAMARCGVDLFGLDQLLPDDGRLDALVWSWATGEPAATGDCAVQLRGGRWEARPCTQRNLAACRTAAGSWLVSKQRVPAADAPAACAMTGGVHAVPRTGYEGQLLKIAANGSTAWLAYRRSGAGWTALDTR